MMEVCIIFFTLLCLTFALQKKKKEKRDNIEPEVAMPKWNNYYTLQTTLTLIPIPNP